MSIACGTGAVLKNKAQVMGRNLLRLLGMPGWSWAN